jgi:membrane-associated HD superfamily phosphohydrolase
MGGDKSLVDERDFRYMGPKPRSRESAILMIADSFEAAGRSLDVMNEQTLTELVERLVGDKARDGQLDESHLTFEDLRKLKHALVQAMVNAGHPRIKYPHREEETIHVSDDEAPPPESTVG